MKVTFPSQMKCIDQAAERMGVPSLILMENAASRVVEHLPNASSFVVFCGKGNNGGDGFAIARQLYTAGKRVQIMAIDPPRQGDAFFQYDLARKLGIPFGTYESIPDCEVIIDGLLGTGLSKPVAGEYERAIAWINQSGKRVIAVDIPSGISGINGESMGTCVKAEKTVTFCLPKAGLFYSDCVGELIVCPISIPKEAIEEQNIWLNLTTEEWVKNQFPNRIKQSHKGDYGKVLVVAGSLGMTGAAKMCCDAALRTGSGIVWLAIPRSLNDIMEKTLTEAMTIPLPEQDGVLAEGSSEEMLPYLKKADVLLFGCGLSTRGGTAEVLHRLISHGEIPMVIDADGLNLLAREISLLKKLKDVGAPVVLTPHLVELSRMSGLCVEEIEKNRILAARDFAMEHHVVLVLKGAGTVIASPQGECYINPTGNPGMATGGSGDVLSGMIASFIGQGVPPFEAAVIGVYLHGLCGDLTAREKGFYSMLPTDMISCIPEAIHMILY